MIAAGTSFRERCSARSTGRRRRSRASRPPAWSAGGWSRRPGALPVAAEVHRRPAAHRQAGEAVDLLAIADAAQVLTPGGLLSVTQEIRPGDVVMVPEFATAQPREVGLRAIGAGAVYAVTLLVVDPPHREAGVQRVPSGALIGMRCGAPSDPQADGCNRIRLGGKYLRQRAPAALTHGNDNLAPARLVLRQPPVDGQVLRPDVTAEPGAVDLG